MRKRIGFFLIILCLTGIGGAFAGEEEIPETILFQSSAAGGGSEDIHPAAYTGAVTFMHEAHAESYSEGCGACHHDDGLEPVEGYDSDESYSCGDCHDSKGYIRGPIAENEYDDEDLVSYRANVLHRLCLDCHKTHNFEEKGITAPESCRGCHEKREKGWEIDEK